MSRGTDPDGIKRGTNYIHRALIEQRRQADESALLYYFNQPYRCHLGEHDEAIAEPKRVTYVRGHQVPPGTRYCRFCGSLEP